VPGGRGGRSDNSNDAYPPFVFPKASTLAAMDTTGTTCSRHPGTLTRLSCSECGTPICPRCAVDAPVGQKCPGCARQSRSVRRQGKPQQYVKAVGFGLAAAVAGVVVLPLLLGVPFAGLILTGVVGFGIGHAVLTGAEQNRAEPFRNLAMALAALAVVVMLLLRTGSVLPGFRAALLYAAALYGAYARFNR
jgi:hypothetical protein